MHHCLLRLFQLQQYRHGGVGRLEQTIFQSNQDALPNEDNLHMLRQDISSLKKIASGGADAYISILAEEVT